MREWLHAGNRGGANLQGQVGAYLVQMGLVEITTRLHAERAEQVRRAVRGRAKCVRVRLCASVKY